MDAMPGADEQTERSMPSIAGNALALGISLAAVKYTGGLFATGSEPDEDRLARKDEARKRFRRPVNELINELGEGRGRCW